MTSEHGWEGETVFLTKVTVLKALFKGQDKLKQTFEIYLIFPIQTMSYIVLTTARRLPDPEVLNEHRS